MILVLITGMLLYSKATFIQVLEGSEKDVRQVYKSICKNSRHTTIVNIIVPPITSRDFSNWSLGFKNLDNFTSDLVPGYIDVFNTDLGSDFNLDITKRSVNLVMNFVKSNMTFLYLRLIKNI